MGIWGVRPTASMRRACAFGSLSWVVLCAAACSTTSTTTVLVAPDDGGAPGDDDGGVSGDDGSASDASMDADGGACNGVMPLGSEVNSTTNETDPAPVAAGGAFHDGTYVLTYAAYYDVKDSQGHVVGSGGYAVSLRETLVVSGTTIQSVTEAATHTTSTITVSGTNVTFRQTCPSAGTPSTTAYTATADEILYIGAPRDLGSLGTSGSLVFRYTRQK
jgi:hypothetical protein